jgi:hypothetical protein
MTSCCSTSSRNERPDRVRGRDISTYSRGELRPSFAQQRPLEKQSNCAGISPAICRGDFLVEAPVSSIKTGFSGSSCGASSRQAWRAAATSGLSCSAACALFFEGHTVTVEKAPNRARRKRRSPLGFEHLGELNQGHIRLGLDRTHDRLMVLFNALGALVAALLLGFGRSTLPPFLDKTHCARDRDPEPFGCRPTRHSVLNRPDYPGPQILRQRLGHACWPPRPARSLNQNSRPRGIPSIQIGRILL